MKSDSSQRYHRDLIRNKHKENQPNFRRAPTEHPTTHPTIIRLELDKHLTKPKHANKIIDMKSYELLLHIERKSDDSRTHGMDLIQSKPNGNPTNAQQTSIYHETNTPQTSHGSPDHPTNLRKKPYEHSRASPSKSNNGQTKIR